MSIHELAGRNWRMQLRQRIMTDDITSGRDELGVLLAGALSTLQILISNRRIAR